MVYGVLEALAEGEDSSLPRQAREMYEELYNSAWEQYEDSRTRAGKSLEETARRVAWTAIKQLYYRDEITGAWQRCQAQDWTSYGDTEQSVG